MKNPASFLFFLLLTASLAAQVQVGHLRVENQTSPLGIGIPNPRFSWQLKAERRNVTQTAYEIQVSNGPKVLWASGKVASVSSVFNEYQGAALASNTAYQWQVRVWDEQGKPSEWAKATFRTALLKNSEWTAQWIGSGLPADSVNGVSPWLRKSFVIKKKVASAVVHATARGLYELHLNGAPVSDHCLAPGWTSYNKHLQYQTIDVTTRLQKGKNALGVQLGSGWYRTRLAWMNQQNIYGAETALLLQLEITYTDGSTERVVSDGTWKAAASDVVSSEIYDGEVQDARLRQVSWNTSGFDDSRWTPVVVRDFPKDYLTAAVNEPIRRHEMFKPKVFTTPKGDVILDFGQNLVGWVQCRLQGKVGDEVRFYHFEKLDKFGEPYFDNLRGAKARFTCTLSGGTDVLEPHFTFFGFQYVKVTGLKNVNPDDFFAVALYSDMPLTGSFECSNALVNQLQHNIQWGQRGNFLDVPTDCPQRDERLGWTGDAEVFSRTAAFNFDVNQFFVKWLRDVAADQWENGAVPFVIPDVLRSTQFGAPIGAAGWSDASVIIPYNLYTVYGDRRVLEAQYESMKAYLNYMKSAAPNDLWNTGFQFADWLSYRADDSREAFNPKSAFTDNHLVAQCFYAYNTLIMLKTARILGKTADAAEFEALLERVKAAFQREYTTASGRLISETQTAYVLALQFDLLPEAVRPQAVERLTKNIEAYKYHLTTGFLGTPFLNPVLTRFGKNDVAYRLLLQETYPSWLYPIKAHGATTIWERWDSMKADSTFQDPGMTSFNHYAYGAVGDWMYRTIAGLDTREGAGAGYKEIVVRPQPGGKLTYATARLLTNYGPVVSGWRIADGKLTLTVEVPANTSATVYFPVKPGANVTESGQAVATQVRDGAPSVVVGSGKYVFEMAY